MRLFVTPEIEVAKFEIEDVVTASGFGEGDDNGTGWG